MPRARNVPATRKRRKKVLKKAKGYFGNKSRLFVTQRMQLIVVKRMRMLTAVKERLNLDSFGLFVSMQPAVQKVSVTESLSMDWPRRISS